MIDWLMNQNAEGPFVLSDEGSLGYSEIAGMLATVRSSTPSTVDPGLDLESIRAIYEAVGAGPMVIGPNHSQLAVALDEDVMTLLSTSGTTGEPKLVPLTLENWKAAVVGSAQHLGHDRDDTWLLAMPLTHVGGLSILFRSSHIGATVRLMPEFEPHSYADALGHGVTLASVVPTMLRRVLDVDDRVYRGLKAVLVGGGPIPRGLLEEAHDRGIPALPTYGMTESCAQVATLLPGSEPAYRADLLPGIEARIEVDGRIALRGDQIFNGYLSEPRRSPEEWFVTGDVGRLIGRELEVLGRIDDVIVTGGENVDPASVENAVLAHPRADSVVVVGIPSDEWGSEVVCLYAGDASEGELIAQAQERLRGFEVPKRWIRVERVPITDMGKPDRAKARNIALGVNSG